MPRPMILHPPRCGGVVYRKWKGYPPDWDRHHWPFDALDLRKIPDWDGTYILLVRHFIERLASICALIKDRFITPIDFLDWMQREGIGSNARPIIYDKSDPRNHLSIPMVAPATTFLRTFPVGQVVVEDLAVWGPNAPAPDPADWRGDWRRGGTRRDYWNILPTQIQNDVLTYYAGDINAFGWTP